MSKICVALSCLEIKVKVKWVNAISVTYCLVPRRRKEPVYISGPGQSMKSIINGNR